MMRGHVFSLIAVLFWGVTFVSTKVLLVDMNPMEIFIYRFVIAYLLLLGIYTKEVGFKSFKEEIIYFALGTSGVTLYFLLENIALQYTLTSNVGIFTSTIPILTSVMVFFTSRDEKINGNLILGILIATIGSAVIVFNGKFNIQVNPIGDFLAFMAAISFAIYSLLLKKVDSSVNIFYLTRKIFFYGLITTIPVAILMGNDFHIEKLLIPTVGGNILFLGIIASSLCFVLWNKAVELIGAVKTSNYIYLIPVVTIISSTIVINEKITYLTIIGCTLTLLGVYISEKGIPAFRVTR